VAEEEKLVISFARPKTFSFLFHAKKIKFSHRKMSKNNFSSRIFTYRNENIKFNLGKSTGGTEKMKIVWKLLEAIEK